MEQASKIAVVTGASRGIGRGVAVALSQAGYRVFATGRSIHRADLPAGVGRLSCDHLSLSETEKAFEVVRNDAGPIDVLVNCAWGGYERMVEDGRFTWAAPFWEQPAHRWTSMMDAGVRTAFVASATAARMMMPRKRGLIVNLSFWAAQKYLGNAIYGIAKAATDKMTVDMAHDLRPHGISVVCLYPGLVRTELVVEAAKSGAFSLDNSESPEFIGRIIAALADDPALHARSGGILVAAALAKELGVCDVDGSSPPPLTLADV